MWVSTNSQVQDLYSDGHEIASHTITHSNGKYFDEFEWVHITFFNYPGTFYFKKIKSIFSHISIL